jgi:hypothetical protein
VSDHRELFERKSDSVFEVDRSLPVHRAISRSRFTEDSLQPVQTFGLKKVLAHVFIHGDPGASSDVPRAV